MRALLVLVCVCRALDLDKFVDKDIRIFFSSANHVFLGLDTRTSRLTARSKYYDLDGFATVARLVPDSSYFRLRFRAQPMCAEGDVVKKCDAGTSWTVRSKVFGYTISDGTKCITLAERSVIKMMPCTESEDQVVDFKLKSEDQDCGQDGQLERRDAAPGGADAHREIIVINVPGKEPAAERAAPRLPVRLAAPVVAPARRVVVSAEPAERILPTVVERRAPPARLRSGGPEASGNTEDSNAGFMDFVHAQLAS